MAKLSSLETISSSEVGSQDGLYLAHKVSDNPETYEDKRINIEALAGALPTEDMEYNNSESGLTATNVQGAIDELAAGGREVLGDLTDVTISSPAANQLLQYNATTEKWENKKYIEGTGNTVSGTDAHAEGNTNVASGTNAHAEGYGVVALGAQSHAEGYQTQASTYQSHAEGKVTEATGENSHAEGAYTKATGFGAHSEGCGLDTSTPVVYVVSSGIGSHAEGRATTASAESSHAEGYKTTASNTSSHAEGRNTVASGYSSHAEGERTIASGAYSHAEGYNTTASDSNTHAEGSSTIAFGAGSHAEGWSTTAQGQQSHSGGYSTISYGDNSFAHGTTYRGLGFNFKISIDFSNIADREDSTKFYFDTAHTFDGTFDIKLTNPDERFINIYIASGLMGGFSVKNQTTDQTVGGTSYSVAGPLIFSKANNYIISATISTTFTFPANSYLLKTDATPSSGTGYSDLNGAELVANGYNSFALGGGVVALGSCQTVIGSLNNPDITKAFIIGNGTIDFSSTTPTYTRSNAMTVDWDGNIIANNIPAPPTTDGTYTLTCTVTNGIPTYSWT